MTKSERERELFRMYPPGWTFEEIAADLREKFPSLSLEEAIEWVTKDHSAW
jgi:hypothetical protein